MNQGVLLFPFLTHPTAATCAAVHRSLRTQADVKDSQPAAATTQPESASPQGAQQQAEVVEATNVIDPNSQASAGASSMADGVGVHGAHLHGLLAHAWVPGTMDEVQASPFWAAVNWLIGS